ncbi:MAG: yvqK [Haloplasmataceae bacterium]|jgi:cob(I)alamin adenosyltransferase|nr:yvqK [Haloplasmataceae bacterium]
MKIYTKTGDAGKTGLLNSRVKKSNFRIEIIGQIDELMVNLAMLIVELNHKYISIESDLKNVYKDLFNIQSYVADEGKKYNFNIDENEVSILEVKIDEMSKELPELKNFIFCTGHKYAVISHQVRTKVRTVERLIVILNETYQVELTILKYLNRLSDYFFTLARFINKKENVDEEIIIL